MKDTVMHAVLTRTIGDMIHRKVVKIIGKRNKTMKKFLSDMLRGYSGVVPCT
jgi:hypothetical protein